MRCGFKLLGLLLSLLLVVFFTVSCGKKATVKGEGVSAETSAEMEKPTEIKEEVVSIPEKVTEETVTAKVEEDMPGEVVEEVAFDNVLFDFDKYFIREDARPTLEKLGSYMMENPDIKVLIEGHCDERGTNEYNFALGERRSQAAKEYLANLAIDSSRVKTISYGEERPLDPGHNEGSWAQNRRAQFVILK